MADEQKKQPPKAKGGSSSKKTRKAQEISQTQENKEQIVAPGVQDTQEAQENHGETRQTVFDPETGLERDPVTGNYVVRLNMPTKEQVLSQRSQEQQEKWAQSVVDGTYNEFITDMAKSMRESVKEVLDIMFDPVAQETVRDTMETLNTGLNIVAQTVTQGAKGMHTFLNSEAWRSIKETIEYIIENAPLLTFGAEEMQELEPYIEEELKKPEYRGITLDELWERDTDFSVGYAKPGSELDKVLELARAAKAKATKQTNAYKPISRPTSYTMPNAKPANKYLALQEMLTQIDPDGQMRFLPIEDTRNRAELIVRNATAKKREVVDIVSLSYYGDLDGKAAKIKSYDQSIYNAVASLLQAGNKVFLLEDIYKTITQKTKATSAQLKRIKAGLDKFSATRIRLDVTNEIENGMIAEMYLDGERIVNGIMEEALLQYRSFTVITDKGTTKTAIEILSEPVLLYYSLIKNQIISIPVELLELPGNATEETISIRDYLLREINQLIKGYRNNETINYINLLKYIGVNPENMSRTERSRITSTICGILDNLRDKKYIKDYKVKNGAYNRVLGFEIII